ncbi:MAG: SGNH/GDSL hydrolase family protein [Pirellulaceae bacterium]|nr:SGNH/GDSL hydrolase family protein [Pirellulaceae bacterium]
MTSSLGDDEKRPPKRGRLRSKLLVLTISCCLCLLFLEVTCQIFLARKYSRLTTRQALSRIFQAAPVDQKAKRFDAELGWANIPNYSKDGITHNSFGFRGPREYPLTVPPGKTRIICIGDSFTYGQGCKDDEAYPARLESLNRNIEAINLGTGGYGIDQAYLKYKRDGVDFETDLLLFTFIQNDFERMALPTFLVNNPKPYLVVKNKSLLVANVPVPDWSDPTRSWLETFPNKTALFRVCRKIIDERFKPKDVFPVASKVFDELHQLSLARSQQLVLVYLPTIRDDFKQRPKYTSRVREFAKQEKIPFIDLTTTFKTLSPERLLAQVQKDEPSGHYSAEGNQLVAETLMRELKVLMPQIAQGTRKKETQD